MTRIIAYNPIKPLATKSTRLVGFQGILTSFQCKQNMHKHPAIMKTPTENLTSKTTIFFLQTAKLSQYKISF